MTFLTIVLLIGAAVLALYAFGAINTPYLDAFRFAFYLLLALLALSVWFAVQNHPHEGYEPTVRAK